MPIKILALTCWRYVAVCAGDGDAAEVRRSLTRQMWRGRLRGVQRNVEVWQVCGLQLLSRTEIKQLNSTAIVTGSGPTTPFHRILSFIGPIVSDCMQLRTTARSSTHVISDAESRITKRYPVQGMKTCGLHACWSHRSQSHPHMYELAAKSETQM